MCQIQIRIKYKNKEQTLPTFRKVGNFTRCMKIWMGKIVKSKTFVYIENKYK
jgi:hypothetical protein